MTTTARTESNGPPSPGREASGQFAKGNKLGRGNPMAKKMQVHRAVILDATEKETLTRVFQKLGELAGEGNVAAAKVYLEYACGKTTQALELSGPDGEALGSFDVKQVFIAIFDALRPFPGEVRAAVAAKIGELSTRVPDA